jgi:Tol biopolymer transport system component
MLVYQAGGGGGSHQLTWVDRGGKRLTTLGEPSEVTGFWISPDGTRAAASMLDPASRTFDLWLYDIARNLRSRFTFEGSRVMMPAIWSPDGASMAFAAARNGQTGLYRKAANLSGSEELLFADSYYLTPTSWSPDGKTILYQRNIMSGSRTGVFALPLAGERKPVQIAPTAITPGSVRFSPDGHWIAYVAFDSQRFEVYVVPYPGPGGKLQISANGGSQPRWRNDGKEIFYVMPDGRLAAAEVKAKGASLEMGRVQPLFGGIPVTGGPAPYDVASGGQRFLVEIQTEQSSPEP